METVGLFFPELLLAFTAVAVILSEVSYRGEQNRLTGWITLVGYLSALLWSLSLYGWAAKVNAASVLLSDGAAIFFRLYFVSLGLLSTALVFLEEKRSRKTKSEFFVFVILLVIALSLGVSTGNVIFLFLCGQCINVITLGILSITAQKSSRAARTSFYFYLTQGVSSGLLLIGFSLLLYYGRSFDLVVLEKVLATANSPGLLGYYCAMFFLFFGLGAYFLGAPLYGWVRDLYVFAPLPAVFILGLSLPVFGLAVVMRLFTGTFNKIFADALSGPVLSQPWVNFLEVVPALGIVFGGIYILKSKSARSAIGAMITIRMSILLSSILHLTPKSLGGFLFDLIPLSISFCGIIGALFFIKGPVDGRIQSGQVFFILFLLVFIGVPPSPSFISIWQIMSSHFDAGNFGLLMLLFFGVFFMVYGFLRLSTGVFQSNGALTFQVENGSIEQIKFYKLFSLALLVPILALALLADQVIKFAEQSLRFIFW